MRQYSADLIEVTWAPLNAVPVDLKPGLAAGPFIQPQQSTPRWRTLPNGAGGIVRAYSPDRSGVLRLLIDVESRTHQELLTISNADEATRSITGALGIVDGNTRETSAYLKAFLITEVDVQKGVTAGVVPWEWGYERVFRQPFGFNNNAVGG